MMLHPPQPRPLDVKRKAAKRSLFCSVRFFRRRLMGQNFEAKERVDRRTMLTRPMARSILGPRAWLADWPGG